MPDAPWIGFIVGIIIGAVVTAGAFCWWMLRAMDPRD